MTRVVISQPMFFPWVGMLEQVALADTYVHYSDVQFSKGSFTNRVQIKTARGTQWLTVPLEQLRLGQRIDEVRIQNSSNWRTAHRAILSSAYKTSPHKDQMLDLVDSVYAASYETIAQLSEASLMALCTYFGLDRGRRFLQASELGIGGSSSRRVLDIVRALGGTSYLTGHGASRYLDHKIFEAQGIQVSYMDYRLLSYAQLHGPFTPYVSALDLVANLGPQGRQIICSGIKDWKEFIKND